MTSESDELNILNLAPDVIRTIIAVGQEDIDTMRFISPQWNNLVIEHLNTRSHLPIIKFFRWSINNTHIKLEISVSSDKFLKYFGVDRWKLQVSSHQYSLELPNGKDGKEMKLIVDRISHIFGRCSRVNRLDVISHKNGKDAFEVLKKVMSGLIVDELEYGEIMHYKQIESEINELAGLCDIKQLILFKPKAYLFLDDSIPTLTQLLKVVTYIELRQSVEKLSIDDNVAAQIAMMAIIQQLTNDERIDWRRFQEKLEGTEEVSTILMEQTRYSGQALLRLTIVPKEQ